MAYELRISDGSSDVGSSDLGVERLAVGGRIHQAALVELPLHLDKGIAEPAQQGDTGRLVVHIGARPAVGGDDAPKDQRSVARLQPGLGDARVEGVARRRVEFGGDAGLVTAVRGIGTAWCGERVLQNVKS